MDCNEVVGSDHEPMNNDDDYLVSEIDGEKCYLHKPLEGVER